MEINSKISSAVDIVDLVMVPWAGRSSQVIYNRRISALRLVGDDIRDGQH